MRILAIVAGLSVLGSLGGLALASVVLLIGDRRRRRLVPWLIAYAVGTLLGVALLALGPEALETLSPRRALAALLGGILGFFLLEKLVLWHHQHETEDVSVPHGGAALILVGGSVHNFADGAIIAAAAMASLPLGISTALAVAAHQVPQELGDFAILLGSGYSSRRALTLNALSGLAGLAGALTMFFAGGAVPGLLPYVLAVAAGNFLYIAMADLIPGLTRGPLESSAWFQAIFIALGVATILAL